MCQPFPPKCFRYHQPSHILNECSQRYSTNLVGECDNQTNGEKESKDTYEGIEATYGNERELACSFIVQKLLLAPRQAEPS